MEECPTNHTPPNAFGIAKTQREKSLCVPSFQLRSSILDVLHVLEAAQTLISFSVTLIQVWTVVGSGVRALHTSAGRHHGQEESHGPVETVQDHLEAVHSAASDP